MRSRLPDVPVLRTVDATLRAATYNRVLRFLSRLGAPQELVLGSRGLHFRLERESWLCSDLRLSNAPLLAWSRFERAGLHSPVACQVFYYHPYASIIEFTALHDLDRRVEAQLMERREAAPAVGGARVVTLPGRG